MSPPSPSLDCRTVCLSVVVDYYYKSFLVSVSRSYLLDLSFYSSTRPTNKKVSPHVSVSHIDPDNDSFLVDRALPVIKDILVVDVLSLLLLLLLSTLETRFPDLGRSLLPFSQIRTITG